MPDQPTIRTKGLECPFCGQPNNALTQTAGDMSGVPHDGAVIICAYCIQPAIVDHGELRRPTDPERAELAVDDGYLATVRALTAMGGFSG